MDACTPGQFPFVYLGPGAPVLFKVPGEFEAIALAKEAAEGASVGYTVVSSSFHLTGGCSGSSCDMPYGDITIDWPPFGEQSYTVMPARLCSGEFVEVDSGGGEPFSGDLNWSDAAHVLQAVMVLVLIGLFFAGYAGGRRA